ncbi:MAG: Phosphate acyltransferase [Chlamydiia bacterium]|nr:Phosphate acyltransferase [Chlamydiia bacterium]
MSKNSPIIGVDLITGDLPALSLFSDLFKENGEFNAHLKFFVPEGEFAEFESHAKKHSPHFTYSFVKTKSTIEMSDEPLSAIRLKKTSAIPMAMHLLKEGEIDAFVSNGNTGALMCGATLILKLLECTKRPGLLALLPTKGGSLAVIDVGANIHCSSELLEQFANIGIAFQKCCGIKEPKVGLLNIGGEKIKGRAEMREAYEKLQLMNKKHKGRFVGNVEGYQAFNGSCDVLVTEGFSGNIFLKTAEGMSAFILDVITDQNLEQPKKKSFRLFDYAEYPGALICGVDGIVVKCHGYSNTKAVHSAIDGAAKLVKSQFLKKLKTQL